MNTDDVIDEIDYPHDHLHNTFSCYRCGVFLPFDGFLGESYPLCFMPICPNCGTRHWLYLRWWSEQPESHNKSWLSVYCRRCRLDFPVKLRADNCYQCPKCKTVIEVKE